MKPFMMFYILSEFVKIAFIRLINPENVKMIVM
jgi:hypothetical protein